MQPYRIVNTVKLRTWNELELLAEKLPGWVYRGQCLAAWRLTSKLERAANGGSLGHLYEAEERALVEFRAEHPSLVPTPLPGDDDA